VELEVPILQASVEKSDVSESHARRDECFEKAHCPSAEKAEGSRCFLKDWRELEKVWKQKFLAL
jgi:hypothetical protein